MAERRKYRVQVNGQTVVRELSAEEAERLGAQLVEPKAKTPANKAHQTTANKEG